MASNIAGFPTKEQSVSPPSPTRDLRHEGEAAAPRAPALTSSSTARAQLPAITFNGRAGVRSPWNRKGRWCV